MHQEKYFWRQSTRKTCRILYFSNSWYNLDTCTFKIGRPLEKSRLECEKLMWKSTKFVHYYAIFSQCLWHVGSPCTDWNTTGKDFLIILGRKDCKRIGNPLNFFEFDPRRKSGPDHRQKMKEKPTVVDFDFCVMCVTSIANWHICKWRSVNSKCHNVTLVMIARSLSSLKLVSKSMICLQLRCWSNTWTAAAAQTINFLKVQGRWRTIFLIIISHDSTVYSMRDAKKRITPHFIIAKFATGCRICRVSYYVIVKKILMHIFRRSLGLVK